MRSVARLVLAAVVAAAGPVLSACSSIPDLDSITEVLETKKKLAGERKPVFPEGVPGVSSGVPPELVRGYREPESGMADPAKAAAEAAAETEKPRKPPPQRTAAVKPKPKPAAVPAAQAKRQPPPAAQPSQVKPWPAQQQQAAQPSQSQPWTAQQQPPAWPSNR